jgi:hypothetical protein
VLSELRDDPELHGVAVAIVTSRMLSSEERERLGSQAQLVLQKNELNAERAREFVAASGG